MVLCWWFCGSVALWPCGPVALESRSTEIKIKPSAKAPRAICASPRQSCCSHEMPIYQRPYSTEQHTPMHASSPVAGHVKRPTRTGSGPRVESRRASIASLSMAACLPRGPLARPGFIADASTARRQGGEETSRQAGFPSPAADTSPPSARVYDGRGHRRVGAPLRRPGLRGR